MLDTAERYADSARERAIVAWLRSRPEEITAHVRIATKVAPPQVDGNVGRFDRTYVEKKPATSLARLGRERVTFLLSHAFDPNTSIEETVDAFAAVVESGRAAPLPAGSRIALQPEGIAERMSESGHDAPNRMRDAAAAHGVSCAVLALAWVIAQPSCTAPIVGPGRHAPRSAHVGEARRLELTAEDHALMAHWFELTARSTA